MKTKAKPTKKKTATSKASTGTRKPSKTGAGARTKKTKAPAGDAALPLDTVVYRTEDTTLPLDCLVPGDNYATRTDEGAAELGDSIRVHGIRTRLWVRPLDKPKGGKTHEIIAGERRYRAAVLYTQLLEAPVTIYHVTQEQAYELNLIENLQREDATAIDEALGFRRLIDECGYAAWNEADPEHSIGHKLGKSKTHVYAMLKLCELSKTGQEAVRKGELDPSVAIRIARIPNKEARNEALADALACEWTDQDAADEIAKHYMTELKGAPFDRKDATLNPKRGSCDKCPFRSGNQAEMFEDMAKGRADICLDPSCYRGKCATAFERRAEAHLAAGGRVMTPEEAAKAGLHRGYSSIGGEWADMDKPAWFLHGDLRHQTPRAILDKLTAEQKCGQLITHLALANDGSAEHFELMPVKGIEQILDRCGLLERAPVFHSENDHAKKQKAEAERRKAIIRHQLDALSAAAQEWARGHGRIGHPKMGDPIGLLLGTITRWLIAERGIDVLRLIVTRRSLDTKAFKLEGDSGNERVQRALESHLDTLGSAEIVGLLCELLAAPAWIPNEAEIDEDRAGGIARLLDIDLDEIHVAACTAIKDAEAAKLGKNPEALI